MSKVCNEGHFTNLGDTHGFYSLSSGLALHLIPSQLHI